MLPGDFFCFAFFKNLPFLTQIRIPGKGIDLCDYCGRAEEEGASSIGSLDQYGDLCGYVHNFCDLWEGDILLTSFHELQSWGGGGLSAYSRWGKCAAMPEVLYRCNNTVALSNLTSSTNRRSFGLLYTKGQLRLRFRLPLAMVVSECSSRGFFHCFCIALHLKLAFAESCPPHLRPRACALVRNNLG